MRALNHFWLAPLKKLAAEKTQDDVDRARMEMLWASGRLTVFEIVFQALLGAVTLQQVAMWLNHGFPNPPERR